MQYKWLEPEILTCDTLSQLIGVKVTKLKHGDISYGVQNKQRKGIEIETEKELTEAQLRLIDVFFVGLQRYGSKSIITEIDELKHSL